MMMAISEVLLGFERRKGRIAEAGLIPAFTCPIEFGLVPLNPSQRIRKN
jgi:hypothetical protein